MLGRARASPSNAATDEHVIARVIQRSSRAGSRSARIRSRCIQGASAEVEGVRVHSTPLAAAWSSAEQYLSPTLAGNPVRRIIEIDVAAGESRRLLLWLDVVSLDHIVLPRPAAPVVASGREWSLAIASRGSP
jgi:hypothetical protein